ncbi:PTS system mannose/fructose/sorbose family transporter subunit IID [Erysipelothrix sp. HDW6A]|uniref:PTS system mannose/fructose/sorbose family transporter subunit IID n=1 Tax=Erysipelothrix sp. HDW6A TaxID=2714928 RepID=UPI001F0ECD6C|nr:PTS system mannose/fructose/sorbose family transporter subunit IID [Erysipelothrix sp. HDW6A]
MTSKAHGRYDKKQLKKLHYRWIWHSQIGWNYERMQGLGYLTTMLPVLKDSYGDNPELMDKALRVHSQFFNTQPSMGDIIVGMNIALEEEFDGEDVIDTAAAIKTSLMGPFAGIGDTVFGMIAGTILGSIAVTFSLDGNYFGLALLVAWSLLNLFVIRPIFFDLGYKQGTALVTTLSHQLNAFTDAASVLGVTVIGAMIASMVNVNFGGIRNGVKLMKEVEVNGAKKMVPDYFLNLQTDLFDKLMPKAGGVMMVALCYWLLGRKNMNSNKLIFGVILFCLLAAALGNYTVVELLV